MKDWLQTDSAVQSLFGAISAWIESPESTLLSDSTTVREKSNSFRK